MAEVMANNDWRDYPFVQWTLTLYTDGLTYNKLWGRWDGSGERMRILLLGSPQHEDDVLEEMTYEIVPYDEYNKEPLTDRKPGWACGSRGDGKTVVYPAGTWYQVIEAGKSDPMGQRRKRYDNRQQKTETTTPYHGDLTSDAGCKVTGSYTGPIDIIL